MQSMIRSVQLRSGRLKKMSIRPTDQLTKELTNYSQEARVSIGFEIALGMSLFVCRKTEKYVILPFSLLFLSSAPHSYTPLKEAHKQLGAKRKIKNEKPRSKKRKKKKKAVSSGHLLKTSDVSSIIRRLFAHDRFDNRSRALTRPRSRSFTRALGCAPAR